MQKIIDTLKNSDNGISKLIFRFMLFVYEKILGSYTIQNLYDGFRFCAYSGIWRTKRQSVLDSKLIKEYHRIEKGLTFSNFRPYFGKKVIDRIFVLIDQYRKQFGESETVRITLHTLQQYVAMHRSLEHGKEFIDLLEAKLATYLKEASSDVGTAGGVEEKKREELQGTQFIDAKQFFGSRSTVRDFSDEDVPVELIEQAVDLARKTPSVCNRQSWRTYVLTKREDIDKALSFQNGNRGFGHKANKLLIVTSDLQTFHTGTERYQQWIDGGMFSMSLIWALHAVGLGACCLNWSAMFYNDIRVRKAVPIKKEESIMMMIAVGHIPETLKVTHSPRKPVEEILTLI